MSDESEFDSPQEARGGSTYPATEPGPDNQKDSQATTLRPPRVAEDWLAILVALVLLACLLGVTWWAATQVSLPTERQQAQQVVEDFSSPAARWLAKPGSWDSNPLSGIQNGWGVLLAMGVVIAAGLAGGYAVRMPIRRMVPGLMGVAILACLAYVMAGQSTVKNYNLEYALWALLLGLLISNTVGTPDWMRPAAMTELFIKIGLVLYGAEILFGRLLALGIPGICIAWIVTPIVLISTYIFGQKVLKIPSRSLNMVISADMSVCGVSAAIATAAACRAKREELSLAIGMSLTFTVVMMVIMPQVILALDLPVMVGGAWLGGTIDSTGAVAAAGAILGEEALEVAATVKMIQNILIGVVAFCVAAFWVRYPDPSEAPEATGNRSVGISEVFRRFPRFILGFVVASIGFSLLASSVEGEMIASATTGASKTLRGWFFCAAFVSIGLVSNFRALAAQLAGGKPLILYLVGQTLNLCLTFVMAWVVFTQWFPDLGPPGAQP